MSPFREIIRKIEAEEEPYVSPYFENSEPPFLSEWIDAKTSLDLIGLSCVSMLSDSLKLYFQTWEKELRLTCSPPKADACKKETDGKEAALRAAFRKGFLNGYAECFKQALGVDLETCPADLSIIQQVALARNRAQHPNSIIRVDVSHSFKERQTYTRPFFANDEELRLHQGIEHIQWLSPAISVSPQSLFTAIKQVEILASWLEEKLLDVKYPGRERLNSA